MTNRLPTLTVPMLPKESTEFKPMVTIDSREQVPLPIRNLPTITAGLMSGDYSFIGGEDLFAVERKSVADLVSCVTGSNRERFQREMHRLRGFRFKRLLIVGSPSEITQHQYRSAVSPQSVWGSIHTWEARFDVPYVFAATPDEAAERVETWVTYCARELLKNAAALISARPELTPESNN